MEMEAQGGGSLLCVEAGSCKQSGGLIAEDEWMAVQGLGCFESLDDGRSRDCYSYPS